VDEMLEATANGAMPRRLVFWIPPLLLTLACLIGCLVTHLGVKSDLDERVLWGAAQAVSSPSQALRQGLFIGSLAFAAASAAIGSFVVSFLVGLGSANPFVAVVVMCCVAAALVAVPAILALCGAFLVMEAVLIAEATALLLVLSALWTWICTMSAPMSATAARAQRDWLASLAQNGEVQARSVPEKIARIAPSDMHDRADHHRRT
jgi:hypothetical protein